MLLDPRRAEENFETDRAKIRVAVRIRLGIVVGLVAVGLFQTDYNIQPDADVVTTVLHFVIDAKPVLGIGAAGLLLVFGLAQRDLKRARDLYESKTLRVPTRKTR